ncbi:MAG: Calx-beta domain-containing protein [Verrucomicrobiota bacterium]|nr:Calx-beta domain-containing protein [Verrucomicrobiota bacterium]
MQTNACTFSEGPRQVTLKYPISATAIFMASLMFMALALISPMQVLAASFFLDGPVGQQNVEETNAFDVGPNAPYLRSRTARIDTSLLAGPNSLINGTPVGADGGGGLILNLFPDREHEVTITRTVRKGDKDYLAYGKVTDSPESQVIFSVSGDVVAATVFVPGYSTAQILYGGNGTHRITEINPAAIPGCDAHRPQAGNVIFGANVVGATPPVAASGLTTIDLMVVYTAAARAGAGSVSAMNALIDLAVAEANEAYANSGVDIELRLVYRGEVSYSESGNASTDLGRLQSTSDSYLTTVPTLRSTYGADVVTLITESMATYAGLGYVMSPATNTFSPYAYNVVKRQYAVGSYVLAHELGHNMGCMHDRDNSSGSGAYSYSYGHRFTTTNGVQRTVMAYAPGTRIPYFSNPSVTFEGVATGIDENATNSANNALSLNNVASIVAGFADEAVFVEFDSASTVVDEDDGTVTLTVIRTGDTSTNSTVQYATQGGTASAGTDYTTTSGTITFAVGETNKTFNVSIINNSVVETNETFSVVLSNPVRAVLGVASTKVLTIQDEDVGVRFSASTASVDEDATNVVLTVNRTGKTNTSFTVDFKMTDLTAVSGSDYTGTNDSLSFSSGDTSKTITIPITNDSAIESNETFRVALTNASGATIIASSNVVVTIAEDDVSVAFSTNAVAVIENASSITVSVTRSGGTNSTVSVDFATEDDTAGSGDYTSTNATLTFTPGQTTKTITVPLSNDSSIEGNEAFSIGLTNVTGGVLGTHSNLVVTIRDNDSEFEFSTNAVTLNESTASVTLTVLRTGGTVGAATVRYATTNGTASAASDYTAVSGTLSFAAGETNKTVRLTILNDTAVETNETFSIVLSNPTGEGSVGAVDSTDVTITDNDSLIALDDATITVAEDDGTATISVTRSGTLTLTNTIKYAFKAGSATASDYTATNGTLTFAPNETNKTIVVAIADDSVIETNETFTLTLSTPTGGAAISGTNIAVITIEENDVGVGFALATYAVAEDGTNVVLTINRTGDTNASVSVDYDTEDIGATAGDDYTATNGTISFSAGVNTATLTIPIANDSSDETNETFRVTLSNPTNTVVSAYSSTVVTIREDDSTIELTTNAVSVVEGTASVTLTLVRNGGTNTVATVDVFTEDGTAGSSDYASTNATVTFNPGQRTRSVVIALSNDNSVEGDETFDFGITNVVGGSLGTVTNVVVTVRDNDSIFNLTTNAVEIAETVGTFDVSITRTGGVAAASSVRYTTTTNTADKLDFKVVTAVLSFAAGETNKTVRISVLNDTAVETEEDFTFTLSSPTGEAALGSVTSLTATIVDNDSNISFADSTISVDEDAGTATLTLERTGSLEYTNTIKYALKAGSATAADFSLTNGVVTFEPTDTNATITINITDDLLVETNESFTVTLSSPTGGALISGTNTARVTIVETDTGVGFATATGAVAEGATNITLTLNRTGDTNGTVSVDYATEDISAVSASDYTATNGTVSFAAGVTSATITIPITADSDIETNQTFRVSLSNPTNTLIASFTNSVVTIQEDDASIELSTNAITVLESATNVVITLVRTGGTNTSMTVDYSTADGSATNALDYTSTSGTLTFNAGESRKTVNVPLLTDTLIDGDETFSFGITNAAGGAVLGSITNVTVTIRDNDSEFAFSTNAVTVSETGGRIVLTVTRTGGVAGTATVRYHTTNDTATAGSDYTTASGMLTFKAGETNKTINITVANDGAIETNETFEVVLSSPTGEGTVATPDSATVTLTDNDSQLSLDESSITVDEDAGSVTITVNRTGTLTLTNTVKYAFKAGSATSADYTATNGTLTFEPNATNATIVVGIVDDTLVETNESFTMTLTTPTGGAVISGTNTARITINETDTGVGFALASYSVGESATNVTITLIRTGATNDLASVDYATEAVGATAGDDYVSTNGTVVFAAGETNATITVDIEPDTVLETNETFRIVLSNPTNSLVTIYTNTVVRILEDDSSFALSTNAVSVLESATNVTVTVIRTGGTNDTVTLDFSTEDDSATDGADYTATNGTLSFGPGVTSKTISIPLSNDTSYEGDETFRLSITNASSGVLGAFTNVVVTIRDNDSTFDLASTSLTKAETAGSFTLAVTRTGGVAAAASVRYSATNGSATASTDFTVATGVLTFAAGETNKLITVTIVNDTAVETNETFTIGLSSPTGDATIGSANVATITITSDDSRLSFEEDSISVDEDDGNASLVINRTGATNTTNTVTYTFKTGSATSADFTGAAGVLTFSPGDTNKTITIPIINDTLVESNEAFTLTISKPTGGALLSGTNIATITIVETDSGVSFSAASYSAAEDGTNVTLTVRRTGATNSTVDVDYVMTDLSAVDGDDYTATNDTVSFSPGVTTQTIVIPITDDSVIETNEIFRVSLTNATSALIVASSNAVVTILEDDSSIALSTNAISFAESATTATITVIRTGGTNTTATVDFLTEDGSASAGSDYTATNGTLTFSPGQASKTITIPITNDSSVEGDQDFEISITNVVGSILGSYTNAVATIRDNDSVFSVLTNAITVAENERTATITIRRTGGVIGAATVRYSSTNGTAVSGTDYTALNSTLKFAAGETNKTFTVAIKNDTTVETNETFTIGLNTPTGEATLSTNVVVTLTITDNDSADGDRQVDLSYNALTLVAFELTSEGTPVLIVGGPLDSAVAIESSSDLNTWTREMETTLTTGLLEWSDPNASGEDVRFYRVVVPAQE